MRTLLRATARQLGLPFLTFSYSVHESWPATMANRSTRGVFFFDDYFSAATVDDSIRARYFVVGVVRPPCDWEVSNWAYLSDLQYLNRAKPGQRGFRRTFPDPGHDGNLLGLRPPYNASDDIGRFRSFLRDPLRGGDSLEHRLQVRYTGSDLRTGLLAAAHCWIWTSSLARDLGRCLEQYASCGGEKVNVTSWLQENEALRDNPSERISCPEYFKADDRALVMSKNQNVGTLWHTNVPAPHHQHRLHLSSLQQAHQDQHREDPDSCCAHP